MFPHQCCRLSVTQAHQVVLKKFQREAKFITLLFLLIGLKKKGFDDLTGGNMIQLTRAISDESFLLRSCGSKKGTCFKCGCGQLGC